MDTAVEVNDAPIESPSLASRPPRWLMGGVLLGLGIWAAALYGVLQLHNMPELGRWLGHGVCGPWGCAARPEALLGYHLFWLVLLTPVGGWFGTRLEMPTALLAGKVAMAIGFGLVAVICGWAIFDCLVNGPENLRQYWLQIAGFKLATNTDLPAVPIGVAGVACWAIGCWRWRMARATHAPQDPAEQSPAAAAESLAAP